uniref:Uncharacterized protein n=1 Tax=Picea glauca TaxID=3330 RepID=A0A101M3Y0_PICGL|nr:hypothetical protein ABT39_MTgene488 [Picea glauca]
MRKANILAMKGNMTVNPHRNMGTFYEGDSL